VRSLQAREVARATPRTRIIRLDLGNELLPFTAGQAVIAGLHNSTLRKPYSIACSPRQAREMNAIELLVQIDDTDATDPHLERLQPGELVDVEGPFGTFGLPDDVREHEILFVAGGTGIAPLRAMLWDSIEHRPLNRLAMIYSARSADEVAYEDELRTLAADQRLDLRITITREGIEGWMGPRGRIDTALVQSVVRSADTRVVVCGPPGMVGAVTQLLRAAGVSEHAILTETFTSQ
jgi:NAD(P)H-flavin reductase